MNSFHVFLLLTSLKLVATSWAALYPLGVEGALCDLGSLQGMLALYSLPNSNFDVWLLAILHSLALLLLLWHVATPASRRHLRGMAHTPPFAQVGRRASGSRRAAGGVAMFGQRSRSGSRDASQPARRQPRPHLALQVSRAISVICLAFQLLLMAKAVVVATLGDDLLLPNPKHCGYSGACMWAAWLVRMRTHGPGCCERVLLQRPCGCCAPRAHALPALLAGCLVVPISLDSLCRCMPAGLLYMYVAICAALALSFGENAAAQRSIGRWKRRLERAREATAAEPLLGSKAKQEGEGEEVRR